MRAGFTLIELLLAVAIIGITGGIVSLSVRGADARKLAEEGDRLAALVPHGGERGRASAGARSSGKADLRAIASAPWSPTRPTRLREELARRARLACAGAPCGSARARLHARAVAQPATLEIDTAEQEALPRARCARQPAPGRLRRMRGFTLIEVLVALAVIGVALLAGVRAAGSMAQTNAELRLRLLAQLAPTTASPSCARPARFRRSACAAPLARREEQPCSAWKK